MSTSSTVRTLDVLTSAPFGAVTATNPLPTFSLNVSETSPGAVAILDPSAGSVPTSDA